MKAWDAIIVGAGPAGSSAAIHLARLGAAVLLVDQADFPRQKVCGCCLNGVSIASLEALGLGDLAADGANRLVSIELNCGGTLASLPLPQTLAISRTLLDSMLVKRAIEAGARFMPATRAALAGNDGEFARVALDSSEAVARIVISADGLAGRFAAGALGGCIESSASRIGAGTIIDASEPGFHANKLTMLCGRSGYAGLAPVEQGKMALAAALDPEFVRESGSLAAAIAAIFVDCGIAPPSLAETRLRGTPGLTRRPRNVAAHRVFAIGDAAGYVEPFTGEGMAWALASGALIAPIAARAAENWSPGFIAEWTTLHRKRVIGRQWLCRMLAWTVRRPLLTKSALALAAIAPALARPIMASLNRPQPRPEPGSSHS